MLQAIEYIGAENLEDLAVSAHKPAPGIYVYVGMDGRIFSIVKNEKRVDFNSKYKMMDYYSGLVSMQKPVKSKLIFSNNYLTFFCRNTEKLTDKDIDDYFSAAGMPDDYSFYKDVVKENIRGFEKGKTDIVKFFLLDEPELYRELGMKNWIAKSISKQLVPRSDPAIKGKGFPVSCSYNTKKPYQMSKMFVVDDNEGLQIKLFHDILKGLKYRGYNMLVVGKDLFIPLKPGEMPDRRIDSAIILAFDIEKSGAVITHIDSIVKYDPYL